MRVKGATSTLSFRCSAIASFNLGSGLVVRVRCLGICHRNQHPPMCLPLVPVRPLSTLSPKNHRSPCWHLAAVARPAEYWEGLFHSSLSDGCGVTHIRKAPENVSFAIRLGNVSNLIRNANILPQQPTARYGFSSFAKPENTPWVYSRASNQSFCHLVWTDTSFLCRSAPDPYSTGIAQLTRAGRRCRSQCPSSQRRP